jgi:hypothetical protein
MKPAASRSQPFHSDPLPGIGPDSQRELAQRRASAPLKPKADQRPLEIGLFGDSHKQTEMF